MKMKSNQRMLARQRRHKRVRKKIMGTAERPRLAVYRSNRHIYAQLIDDFAGRTVAAATSQSLADGADGSPQERAKAVGMKLARKAQEAGVSAVVFDRGGFLYHGQVRALAEGAREGGLAL
ncbi:50S ribosomal protein L18 [soil metagenome]